MHFTINGEAREAEPDIRASLLDVLREHLGLTESKKGCDHGQCGASTVLVNGRRIKACLTLAVMHQDDDILTIEGLGRVAVVNAVHDACGVRVRDFPITVDKLLAELPAV